MQKCTRLELLYTKKIDLNEQEFFGSTNKSIEKNFCSQGEFFRKKYALSAMGSLICLHFKR